MYFVFLTFIFACNQPIKSNDSSKKSDKDYFYEMSSIKNLDFLDNLHYDLDSGNLYLDSLKNRKFKKLNNEFKLKYLKGLKYEGGSEISKDWLENDIQAYLIGTLPTIANFQPTIIKVNGTDHSSVQLVNIDENGKLVSNYTIYYIGISSVQFIEDTLIITRPKIKCRFSNNCIFISKMIGMCNPQKDSLQKFSIKQFNYKTIINNKGEASTLLIDSLQFDKKCTLDYF